MVKSMFISKFLLLPTCLFSISRDVDAPFLCRVWEKAQLVHQDEKKEQKFERVNIDLLQSRAWMEKVLAIMNKFMTLGVFYQCSVFLWCLFDILPHRLSGFICS